MPMTINTNLASINAQRNLDKTQGRLDSSLARLSSGLRINQAKDDAAGLAISEKLRAQIRGLGQAQRNANDGISLVQSAEGALNEVSGILVRMRELSIQASTGTLGDEERGYLNAEFQNLMDEVDRISNVTEFNGAKLLDGTQSAGINFQVGLENVIDDRITVSIGDIDSTNLGIVSGGPSLFSQVISTASGALNSLNVIDQSIQDVSDMRGRLGAAQNRLSITVQNLSTVRENLAAANSRIRDVDVADETVEMTRSQILMQAGVSVLAQANQIPSMALKLLG